MDATQTRYPDNQYARTLVFLGNHGEAGADSPAARSTTAVSTHNGAVDRRLHPDDYAGVSSGRVPCLDSM